MKRLYTLKAKVFNDCPPTRYVLIIEQIYGIPFNNPPVNIKNRPFLKDENIKNNFENYSEEKWKMLSEKFNFHGIIIPADWKIKLKAVTKGESFTLYII